MHGEKPTLRRRVHAILLSNHAYTINQINKPLFVGRETVSIWLKTYDWEIRRAAKHL